MIYTIVDKPVPKGRRHYILRAYRKIDKHGKVVAWEQEFALKKDVVAYCKENKG